MSIKKVCDRCNKVREEDGEDFDHVDYTIVGDHKNNDNKYLEYDLCPECSKQFRMFINGGTVEEDHYKDSKPCAVVIHKLTNGNYGIENVPDADAKETNMHCFSCKHCDPYCSVVPENHGHCLMKGEVVAFDTVACDHYIANDSKEVTDKYGNAIIISDELKKMLKDDKEE